MDKVEKRINIDDITCLEDMEKFFTLLNQERIGYHPEVSFHDMGRAESVDGKPAKWKKSFSDEEADHLDNLMHKCYYLCDELDLDIFEFCMAIDEKVRGRIDSYHNGEKES